MFILLRIFCKLIFIKDKLKALFIITNNLQIENYIFPFSIWAIIRRDNRYD